MSINFWPFLFEKKFMPFELKLKNSFLNKSSLIWLSSQQYGATWCHSNFGIIVLCEIFAFSVDSCDDETVFCAFLTLKWDFCRLFKQYEVF